MLSELDRYCQALNLAHPLARLVIAWCELCADRDLRGRIKDALARAASCPIPEAWESLAEALAPHLPLAAQTAEQIAQGQREWGLVRAAWGEGEARAVGEDDGEVET